MTHIHSLLHFGFWLSGFFTSLGFLGMIWFFVILIRATPAERKVAAHGWFYIISLLIVVWGLATFVLRHYA